MDDLEEAIEIPNTFRGLDPDLDITVRKHNLPHWRQDGASYFVTFRLADALPQSVIRDLELERKSFRQHIEREKLEGVDLAKAVSRFEKRYRQRYDDELDKGCGSCVLRGSGVSDIVSSALGHFHDEHFELYAGVVMPNHCHVIVRPMDGWPLDDILESWKGFTARQINTQLGRTGSLWQSESYDRIVRDEDHFRNVVRYILANPKKAKLPPGSYRFTTP